MSREIELILERLKGTDASNQRDLMGFDSKAIGKLISKQVIVRTKERCIGGTYSKYYLTGISWSE